MKDEDVQDCVKCRVKFDFIRRRARINAMFGLNDLFLLQHHCRRCGSIFCARCCGQKVQFHRMGFIDPVRHCLECAKETSLEERFFRDKLKVLVKGEIVNERKDDFICRHISGSAFLIRHSSAISQEAGLYMIRLSTDERRLLLAPHGQEEALETLGPLDLAKIQTLDAPQGEGD